MIDLQLCRNRGKRGAALEQHGAELCFDMIIQDLMVPEHDGQLSGMVASDFTYQRNIYWWKNGHRIGEIDLAILHQDEVVAICEMKASCVEIGVAIRQHENKLLDPSCSMGRNAGEPLQCHQLASTPLPLYFATLHPEKGEQIVGAEPMLVNAICEGIRSQGLSIASDRTTERCRPLAPMLREQDEESALNKSLDYLQSMTPTYLDDQNPSVRSDIDYEQLREFVVQRVGADQLVESPTTCLLRHSHRILVIPYQYMAEVV